MNNFKLLIIGTGPSACMFTKILSDLTRNKYNFDIIERGYFRKSNNINFENTFSLDLFKYVYKHDNFFQPNVVGGGSMVNSLVYYKNTKKDIHNCFGSNYLKYLTKFNYFMEEKNMISKYNKSVYDQYDKMFINDFSKNIIKNEMYVTVHNSKRVNSYTHLLKSKNNCNLIYGENVEKILFENINGKKIATGIMTKKKKLYYADCIVLGAGCIETPILLMKSGIGDEEMLGRNGINVEYDNKYIGKNIKDHYSINDYIGISKLDYNNFDYPYQLFTKNKDYCMQISINRSFDPLLFKFIASSKRLNVLNYINSLNKLRVQHKINNISKDSFLYIDKNKQFKLDISSTQERIFDKSDLISNIIIQNYEELNLASNNIIKKEKSILYNNYLDFTKDIISCLHFSGSTQMGLAITDKYWNIHGIDNLHVIDTSVCNDVCYGNTQSLAYLCGFIGAHKIANKYK